ncbi:MULTISPECIES: sialate O-acetylesterase [unclassified Janthinobacterium]|uniref:sialate O-acetylesterase n=1 Tax=unclassified Janthinobacterium TaxID=2610881 RepID=UPI00160D5597|nr:MULTISPECIES: sialate O-acetylesterase [unclassified Janthinobacterium]MBB5607355.1 hypothetical protein [Janthinobacterium sp. S3T4]MBB5612376.1 hypothetical protein [Janthinobacterium sp. S3M3]
MKIFFVIRYIIVFIFCSAISACGGGGASATPAAVTPPVAKFLFPELRILVLGQSISSNCNESVYGPVNNVLQIGKNGAIKAAADPFEWADCARGSMWMPLGRNLIEAGIAQKVIFMPIGVAGSKVGDWQAGGAAFGKLDDAIALIQANGLNFDFAFWHQGSSDYGIDQKVYSEKLNSVLNYVNGKVKISRWLIAIHSRCSGLYDKNVEAAQLALAAASNLHRYPGANNNLLGDEYRFDGCHLNKIGQEKMASMWVDSINYAVKQ